jgi:putative ABC transport system ATP-binding protein
MAYIEVKNEYKQYQMGETEIFANRDVNFEVEKGQVTVILGPSGAGKSTVLNMLGGMDSPTSGEILVDNTDIANYNDRQLTQYRRNDVGFVFQFYNLIPNLTTLENVELATSLVKDGRDPAEVLREVGLQDRLGNFPSQLSGGEQQTLSNCTGIG